MDCLRQGWGQGEREGSGGGRGGFAYLSLFQLAHYFIFEIPPCGFCHPENTSDEGVLDSLILALLPDRCWHLSWKP